MNQSVRLAINSMEPSTKAGKLRPLLPDIEQKIALGVRAEEIHKLLVAAGFDLSFQTFKKYLYRYRKNSRVHHPQENLMQKISSDSGPARLANDLPAQAAERAAVSMQQIDRLMKPHPAEQAEKLARYERLAKIQRRGAR